MRLLRRVRVIRTRRELPGWVERFRWVVTGLCLAALVLIILKSGYRLPFSRTPIWSSAIHVFNLFVLLVFTFDAIINFIHSPSLPQYFKQRWFDLAVYVPVVIALFAGGSGITFVVLRQIIVVTQAFTRSHRFSGLLERLRVRPVLLMVLSFVGMILVGTLLLTFPAATADGRGTNLINALFTATSATCVTGLVVKNTPIYFSRFGQLVILGLLQLGGIGIMTFSASLAVVFGRRLGSAQRKAVSMMMEEARNVDIARTLRYILFFTLLAESVGALLLLLRWLPEFPSAGEALYKAVFHSVSAFCNAGFSVFADSLEGFRSDPAVNLIIMGLVVTGGLGFIVVRELLNSDTIRRGPLHSLRRMSTHARLVLWTTGILLLVGTVFFFFSEYDHALASLRAPGKLLASVFQSVTPRTAGFSTIPIGDLRPVTLFLWAMLMFVGASPGGTGGGIKTSTLAVLFLAVRNRIRGREEVEVKHRVVPKDIVYRATAIAVVSGGIVALFFAVLLTTESAPFQNILFETVSAFGTVGLTTGLTPNLSPTGKVAVTLLMYIGRLGPLTLALAMRTRQSRLPISYPAARVMVG